MINSFEDEDGHFHCDLCNYNTTSRSLVLRHRKTHYDYRPYGCAYCNFQAFCRTRIQAHHRRVHSERTYKFQIFEKPAEMTLSKLDKRLSRTLFSKREKLVQKQKSTQFKPREPKFNCTYCVFISDNREILDQHLLDHKNELCKCTYCDFNVTNVDNMKMHLEESHKLQEPIYVNLETGKLIKIKLKPDIDEMGSGNQVINILHKLIL